MELHLIYVSVPVLHYNCFLPATVEMQTLGYWHLERIELRSLPTVQLHLLVKVFATHSLFSQLFTFTWNAFYQHSAIPQWICISSVLTPAFTTKCCSLLYVLELFSTGGHL